ncbi:MAG: DJ-1/PfpI family protein [bacterium]
MKTKQVFLLIWVWLLFRISACGHSSTGSETANEKKPKILNAGFLCIDGVYNSELMAPYDVLQHSVFRDSSNYIRCFIVTPDGKPFTTFEGIHIAPDYAFANVPPMDILIIPSTATSMNADIKNTPLIKWLKKTVQTASYVITVCDGAFPLAATGALDNRLATTFPTDRQRLAELYPKVKVQHDVNLVVDGKYITSAGGALSYQPALYLVEKIYSPEHAQRTAQGLVLEWDLKKLPHKLAGE